MFIAAKHVRGSALFLFILAGSLFAPANVLGQSGCTEPDSGITSIVWHEEDPDNPYPIAGHVPEAMRDFLIQGGSLSGLLNTTLAAATNDPNSGWTITLLPRDVMGDSAPEVILDFTWGMQYTIYRGGVFVFHMSWRAVRSLSSRGLSGCFLEGPRRVD